MGTQVNYVSTGAGMFCCYADKNLGTVPQNSIKFASSGPGGALWWGNVTIPDFEILSGFTSCVGPYHSCVTSGRKRGNYLVQA